MRARPAYWLMLALALSGTFATLATFMVALEALVLLATDRRCRPACSPTVGSHSALDCAALATVASYEDLADW